ncbi:MAG TPA: hypothetical protein ENN17_09350 [bacterium]|nr:hypothetical protein [bacterium]
MTDFSPNIRLRDEFYRKGIHLASLWIPIGYIFLPGKTILAPLCLVLTAAVIVETLRTFYAPFERWFERILGSLLRPRERRNVTGATTMLVSAVLSIVFFEKWIAVYVILLMLVSDALGAIVGRLIGRHLYKKGRTVEGSAAFAVSGFMLIWIVPDVRIGIALAGLFTALILETGIIKLDDNIAIPIGAGMVMEILYWTGRAG